MGRVGIAGYMNNKAKFLEARPVLVWIFDQIENALNGQIDSTNIAASGVGTTQIADGSVTAVKILAGSLTSTQMADGVGQMTSLDYVGDGTTANRLVALGFTPRWAKIIRTDATFIEFEVAVVGASFSYWYRDAAGLQASNNANWQGISGTSLKLGTSAVGTSNAVGVTYRVVAWK